MSLEHQRGQEGRGEAEDSRSTHLTSRARPHTSPDYDDPPTRQFTSRAPKFVSRQNFAAPQDRLSPSPVMARTPAAPCCLLRVDGEQTTLVGTKQSPLQCQGSGPRQPLSRQSIPCCHGDAVQACQLYDACVMTGRYTCPHTTVVARRHTWWRGSPGHHEAKTKASDSQAEPPLA